MKATVKLLFLSSLFISISFHNLSAINRISRIALDSFLAYFNTSLLTIEKIEIDEAIAELGITRLAYAVGWNNPELLSKLIDSGEDVNAYYNYSNSLEGERTALHEVLLLYIPHAYEMAKLLIAAGADVNAAFEVDEITPLHLAARHIGTNALKNAKLLIDAGAHVNARTISGMTPLYFARDAKMIDLLLEYGAELNAANLHTPLIYASYFCHADVVKHLLKRGAQVHHRDNNGFNALHAAVGSAFDPIAQFNLVEIVEASIKAKANVNNINDYGDSVLDTFYTISFYSEEIRDEVLSLLLQAGARSAPELEY